MWRFALAVVALGAFVSGQNVGPRSGDELVSTVTEKCADMDCVKLHVLSYLDNVLNLQSDTARSAKNIDTAILKRVARVLQTHELRYKLPETLFDGTEIVYNPKTGLDIKQKDEGRVLGLKKKLLLLPVLKLFKLLKLKMKALMVICLTIVKVKALKALILSKLALGIILGYVIYQLATKAGLKMPMMAPMEPPASMYGPPMASTAPPSSYEPSWDSNQGGPYSRVWTNVNDASSIAYSAHQPRQDSSSTSRP